VRVAVIEQSAQRTVFHNTCPSCETSMVLVVTQGQMGTLCVGSVTDVAAHEVARLTGPRIQPDAVLDLYTDLRQYKGTLAALLGERTNAARKAVTLSK